MYRSHVLVCGGTGCTSSGSQKIVEELEKELQEVRKVKWSAHISLSITPKKPHQKQPNNLHQNRGGKKKKIDMNLFFSKFGN